MKIPMTVQGAEALRAELARLKSEVRPQIVQAIAEARAHGDLRENAEYHAAKEQQGFTEGRINEIESKLADAQVIDVTKLKPSGKVIFGATVTLLDVNTEATRRYQIVGEDESDLKLGKISVMSPLARTLIGKHQGEVVTVSTPKGADEYEIVQVEHL
jgi:transcription elongation factor GreA